MLERSSSVRMVITLFCLFFWGSAGSFVSSRTVTHRTDTAHCAGQDTIRLLCIGNSFSWDAVEQELAPLAAAAGQPILIGNLYYGGCSLLQHYTFLLADTAAYSYRLIEQGERRVFEGKTLRQALRERRWDYITFQQASGDSGDRTTFEPYLSQLIDTVRGYQPAARLCWLMTWAYAANSHHPDFPRYHSNQREMYDSICRTTQWVLQQHPTLLLIPCGVAVQNARRTMGDTLCRDGYHLNYQYGRYTASCTILEVLLNQPPHTTTTPHTTPTPTTTPHNTTYTTATHNPTPTTTTHNPTTTTTTHNPTPTITTHNPTPTITKQTTATRKTRQRTKRYSCVGIPYRNPAMTRRQQRQTQRAAHRATQRAAHQLTQQCN